MPKVPGKLLRIKIDGEYISCETSCDFNCEVEMRGASAVTSGRYKEVIPGLRSWSINLNANLLLQASGANVRPIMNAILSGDIIEVEMSTDAVLIQGLSIVGKAHVSTLGISGAASSNVGFNTTLTGSGPIEYMDGSFNVGFGFSATNPFGHEAELVPQFFKDVGLTSMDLNFTTDSAGNYLFAKVPLTLVTVFDEWYASMYNFGTIPDFVWRDPVTVGDYRYYLSRDPLYFTSDDPDIKFTKS